MSPVQFRPARGRLRLLAVLLAPLAAAACHDSAATPSAPPPPEVGVVTVAPRPLPLSYEFVGEVQPIRRVEVRARVDGVIEARPFTEGAFVKAGDVLYRLERIRYDAAYRSASARLANAQRTLARLEPLAGAAGGGPAGRGRRADRAEAAQAALDEARKDREDAVVRAEISGRVGRTRLEVGARVTGPADLLTTIEQLDPVYVTLPALVPGSAALARRHRARAGLIRPGQRPPGPRRAPRRHRAAPHGQARLRQRLARSGDRHAGVPRHLRESRPAAGARPVRAGAAGGFVRHGCAGGPAARGAAVAGAPVRARRGPRATPSGARDVTPGPWSGERWIIEKGLAPGDRVIVDGVQKAMPGSVVHPVPAADTAAAGDSAGTAPARRLLRRSRRRTSHRATRPSSAGPRRSATSSSAGRCSRR